MGLAYPRLSAAHSNPVHDNLWLQKLIDHFIFAIYITDIDGSSGSLIFGNVETKYMASNFTFFDVYPNGYWEIEI